MLKLGGAAALAAASLVTAVVLGTGTVAAASNTYYAAPSAQGTQDCSSAANACSLSTALSDAGAGDTVELATGTYTGSWTISSAITLQGEGALATDTVLDRTSGAVVFTSNPTSGTVTINDVEIENGDNGAGGGGGVDVTSGSLTVNDVTFYNNYSSYNGGAIDNGDQSTGGTITVNQSTFTNNSAGSGGAIASATNGGTGTVIVIDSSFSNNTASWGGAIDSGDGYGYPSSSLAYSNGSLSVYGSTFSGDTASTGGGAISSGVNRGTGSATVSATTFSGDVQTAGGDASGGAIVSGSTFGTGTLSVWDATFSGDSASYGGAIANGVSAGAGSAIVSDSTFSGNSASDGGAIDNDDSEGGSTGTATLAVTSSTFDGNGEQYGYGGAILNSDTSSGSVGLAGDVIATTTSNQECYGVSGADYGYNVDDDGSCGLTGTGSTSASSVIADYLGNLSSNGGEVETIPLLSTPSTSTSDPDPAEAVIPSSGSDTYVLTASGSTVSQSATEICSVPDAKDTFGSSPCSMGSYQLDTTTAPSPTVSGVSPNSGPTSGGTTVTITGSNFTAGSTVHIGQGDGITGALPFTDVRVVSPTEIIAATPGNGITGTWNVFVTATGGTSIGGTSDQFSYGGPTAAGVSPTSGPAGGGTTITITGTNFTAPATVLIGQGNGTSGAISATDVTVVSPTEITAVTPGNALLGTWNVFVTTRGGATTSPGVSHQFTYVAPTVTGVSPTSANVAQEPIPITITGTNFAGPVSVLIGQGDGVNGATSATNVTVVSSTEITADAPEYAKPGTWNVFVVTGQVTSAANGSDQFTYAASPPDIYGISPTSGPTSGGTTITITGTNFTPDSQVSIGQGNGHVGALQSSDVTFVSSSEITAVTPGGAIAGTWNVFVKTPSGYSPAPVYNGQFTYTG